jgi:hypothetical protein
MSQQIPKLRKNLRYGKFGSVTVGVGGSALVTGDVSTGSGGGGGVAGTGAATVDVGRGDVDTGSALAAVEVALVTVCVTCVTCVAGLFAAVVTACVTGVADAGKALDSIGPELDVTPTPVAPRSG